MKTKAYPYAVKVNSVINSCKTLEQLDNAAKLPLLHYKLFGIQSFYDFLLKTVSYTNKKLINTIYETKNRA